MIPKTIQSLFESWVIGIFEDAPLPYEINYIYFCLSRNNNTNFICFGGNELELKLALNFEFFPLEAQFFQFVNIDFTLFDLRKLVETSLKNEQFAKHFQQKQLFVAILNTKDIYRLEN